MSHPNVFTTGATGYIGGDAMFALYHAHTDWNFSTLVRNRDKVEKVQSLFPKLRIVQGDLNDAPLIEDEIKRADIIYHFADADHVNSAISITSALKKYSTPTTPKWLIHTSGAGILMALDIDSVKFGIEGTKIYDDWEGIGEVTSLPEHAPHRETEKVILAAGSSATDHIKTAIVCPPAIYGLGRGPGRQIRSQIHMLAAVTLKIGKGVRIGEGANKWNAVHIQDLSNLYVLLGEAAMSRSTECTWGLDGYYFAESEEVRWGEVSEMIAKIAFDRGLINSTQVAQLSITDSNNLHPLGIYWWGTNSRSRALRARKLLGWESRMPALVETLPEIVELEAKKLSLI